MIKKIILFILLASFYLSGAQETNVFTIDSENASGVELDTYWKFHEGDDTLWANEDFDDTAWDTINIGSLDDTNFKGIGWFRLHLNFDSSLASFPLAIGILQASASEIYFNGQKLINFGTVSSDPEEEERYYPNLIPVALNIIPGNEYVLAIRYSNHKSGYNRNINYGKGFRVFLFPANEQIVNTFNESVNTDVKSIFPFGFIIALGIAHLFIFLFYRANKSNFFYFLFASLLSFYALAPFFQTSVKDAALFDWFDNLSSELIPVLLISLIMLVYSIFYERIPKAFWFPLVIGALNFFFILFQWEYTDKISYFFIGLTIIEVIRVVIIALINKKQGSTIIGIGVAIFILFVAAITLIPNDGNFSGYLPQILFTFATMSIPVSMSLYLAKQFSTTNKILKKKLTEVESLSKKNLEQEKEKQKILETQKETLEIQVKERTSEIVEQKKIIEEKNKDITDSIDYAKTIQDAILPTKEFKHVLFPDSFILFKPKDTVSGDFYWFAEKDGRKLIAACDCTGHGVPGALMSMIGNNILNQIVNEKGITSPDEILNHLHKEIRKTLKQEEQSESKDGMDISLITFITNTEIEFAGAQRPLWIIKKIDKGELTIDNGTSTSTSISLNTGSFQNNYQLTEIKGNKFAIGGAQSETERKFTRTKVSLMKGDCIYIFSDGYADQFSSSDEKLMTKRFKEIFLSIQQKQMDEQRIFLEDFIEKWKDTNEQIDDILVIGIRI
ncbi:MAG: SpoIIE family protein phosphatase [Bacteroidia bacterium]|nr:SpoIIE family protein phosphatase [Bacteroidia bacterium]